MRWRAVAVVVVLLLLAAAPASAQEALLEFLGQKVATFVVVMTLASFVFQVAFVKLGAGVLGLEGGLLHAFGTVILGGIFGVVASIGAFFTLFTMPPTVQGLVLSSAWMAGFAVAVKLIFKCPFPKALLITLVAFTLNMVGGALVMILMY